MRVGSKTKSKASAACTQANGLITPKLQVNRETPGQESQHGDDIFLLRTQGSCGKINSQPPLVVTTLETVGTDLRMESPAPKVPFPSLEYPNVLGRTISTPERPPLSFSSMDNLLLERLSPLPLIVFTVPRSTLILHRQLLNTPPPSFAGAEMNTLALTLRQGLT